MATLKSIAVPITANAKKLYSALDRSAKRLRSFASGAVKSLGKIGAGLGLAGAAIATGIVVAVNKTAASLDKVIKKARSLGIATRELEALRYAAELSGVESAAMDKAFQRMLKTVGDARSGLTTATDALDIIGVKLEDIENLSPSQQFAAIAGALGQVKNQADKTKAAMDIFGRSGSDLTNLFSSDINALINDFEDLDLAISDSQQKAIEAFNDSKTRLSALFGGFTRQLTGELAAPFTFIIEKITESIKEMGGMREAAKKFAGFVIEGMKFAADAIEGVIDLVLSLREFMAETKLFAISLGETLKATYQSLKNQIPFVDHDVQTGGSDAGNAAAQELLKIQNQRQRFEEGQTATHKFINDIKAGVDRSFTEGAAKIKSAVEEGAAGGGGSNGANSAIGLAEKGASSLADSAKRAAETLDKVSKSSAWQDIFGKEKVTARAADFDEYARLARANIQSSSSFAQSNIDTLKDIVKTAQNNQGQVFNNQGTFSTVDIAGMQAVIKGLEAMAVGQDGSSQLNPTQFIATKFDEIASNFGGKVNSFGDHVDKLAQTNANQPVLGKLSIDLSTDTGKIAGEIWGEPEFVGRLKDFVARTQNDAARAASS